MFYISALALGSCLATMAIGVFLAIKIFKIPDITTDGSFTLGAAVTAVALQAAVPVWCVIPLVLLAGAAAGFLTAFIHTRLKIDALLAGILVMTALFSVNLGIMGRSNIPLINESHLFSTENGIPQAYKPVVIGTVLVLILIVLLFGFLLTDFGIAMRASGDSATMSEANGVNNNTMKQVGLAISNSFTALAGFLVTQYQGFADVNMGVGIVITALGSVLLGDALISFLGIRNMALQLVCVVLGCWVFQLVLALALSLGVNPIFLKGITAVMVLLIVAFTRFKSKSYAN
jgi:putative tryptophan/tyrosine transport system permease protein